MGRNPLVQARVEPDTKEMVEQYAEERNISQSKAARRMLHRQLNAEGTAGQPSPTASTR